jgi:hypothetical protein
MNSFTFRFGAPPACIDDCLEAPDDQSYHDNEELALNKLYHFPHKFLHLSCRLQNNREFILECIKRQCDIFLHIPLSYRYDEEVIMEAIKNRSSTGVAFYLQLALVSERLKKNKKFALQVLSQHPYALSEMHSDLRHNRSFLLQAIRKNEKIVNHLDIEFYTSKDFILDAIQVNGRVAEHMYSDFRCDSFMRRAIERNPLVLYYASKKLKEDYQLILSAVSKDPFSLDFASSALKDDLLIVSTAVKQNGWTLRCATDRLRDNKHLISIAYKHIQNIRHIIGIVLARCVYSNDKDYMDYVQKERHFLIQLQLQQQPYKILDSQYAREYCDVIIVYSGIIY